MGDAHGVYSWAVRTYECGPDGVATMASVCNWLQEAASLNAEALAFSKTNFEAAGENISWVLTRLKVRMSRFPKWGETVSILTFPRGDIDLNGHVNNVHYVEWLMEGCPDAAGPCRELDIVFKSETLAGEEVRVESVEVEPGAFIHRVYAPDGRDHVLARTR